jgi:anti-sigma B factor antagonist
MGHECPRYFQVARDQGCLVVTAPGPEIDFESRDELYALAEAGGPDAARVVLDLERVVNYKSAILGVLIQFRRKVEAAGGRLKVVCPDPDVLTMFHITRVDQVLDLHESRRSAIAAFEDSARPCAASS